LILIFSPETPEYGQRLAQLVEEDGRFDAEVQVVESAEVLRVKMYFPNVKLVIVALSKTLNLGIGPTLEWFFNQGGGLVGLGFSSHKVATLNASAKVFPAFGNSYVAGFYDAPNRRFMVTHLKSEEDEISAGLGDFNISGHKVILSFNGSANKYLPQYPEEGSYKILYREANTGAPTIFKYENVGVSMTFACFAGEDFERGPSYHGRFTSDEIFIKLFTNSVAWVWENENKFEESMEGARQYFEDEDQKRQDAIQGGKDLNSRAETGRTIRTVLIIAFAVIGVIAVYWVTFTRKPEIESGS